MKSTSAVIVRQGQAVIDFRASLQKSAAGSTYDAELDGVFEAQCTVTSLQDFYETFLGIAGLSPPSREVAPADCYHPQRREADGLSLISALPDSDSTAGAVLVCSTSSTSSTSSMSSTSPGLLPSRKRPKALGTFKSAVLPIPYVISDNYPVVQSIGTQMSDHKSNLPRILKRTRILNTVVRNGLVRVLHCDTKRMEANYLTKSFSGAILKQQLGRVMCGFFPG